MSDDLQFEDESSGKGEKLGLTGACLGSTIVVSYIIHKIFFPDAYLLFLIGACAILVPVYFLTTTLEKKLKLLKEARLSRALERMRRDRPGTLRKSDRRLIEEDLESRLDIGGDLAQFLQAIAAQIKRLKGKAHRLDVTSARLKLDDLELITEAIGDERLKVMGRVMVFFGQEKIDYRQTRHFLNEMDGLLQAFTRTRGHIITVLDQVERNLDQASTTAPDGTPRADIEAGGQRYLLEDMNGELERLREDLDATYQAMRGIISSDSQ